MGQLDQHWYDAENGDYVNPENKPNDGKSLYSGRSWKEMTVAQKFASSIIIFAMVFFVIGTYFTGKGFAPRSLFLFIF